MKSFKWGQTLTAISLIFSLSGKAESIPGQSLLEFFGSTCATGDYTQSALGDSKALISILEKLASDVDCQSVAGSVGSLQLLQQQLTSLTTVTGTQADIAEVNSKEQQLLTHLSQTTDPVAQSEINTLLREIQVERAGILGRNSSQQDLNNPDKTQMAVNAIYSAQAMYSQLTSNQKCMAKHPTVLNTATSIVSSVGAGVALINPAIGFALNAGANFVGAMVEGARKIGISRDIRRLSADTVMIEGVKCALETMSDRYCLSLDTEKFINFKTDLETNNLNHKPLGKALLLSDRQLPIFLEWLKKVRSGVVPTTTAEAGRVSMAISRDAMLRATAVQGIGLINNTYPTYNSYAGDSERQWNLIRTILKKLVQTDGDHSYISNPLYDIIPGGYGPYYLINVPDNDQIRSSGRYTEIDSFIRPPGFKITLDEIKSRYEQWVKDATVLVERERNQVQQPDAQNLIHSANNRTSERFNISPLESLKDIIQFIQMHPPGPSNKSFEKIYASTLKKLTDIESEIEQAVLLDLPKINEYSSLEDDPLQTTVKSIYRTAQLDYGTIVMESRIDLILSLSLYEMLENSTSEDQVLVAQLKAANRFSDNLKKGTAKSDTAILVDIENSKSYMHKNLENLVYLFKKNINALLATLIEREKNSEPVVAKSVKFQRSQLCHLLLAVPKIESYVDLTLCEGLVLSPILKGGPSTTPLTIKNFQDDIDQRACTRREFLRKSLIYEKWKIR